MKSLSDPNHPKTLQSTAAKTLFTTKTFLSPRLNTRPSRNPHSEFSKSGPKIGPRPKLSKVPNTLLLPKLKMRKNQECQP